MALSNYSVKTLCQSTSMLRDTAEIVLINPVIPQSLGIFKAGGHPQTPGRKHPAPLFQHSLRINHNLVF
jgi:hypothetical protein